MGAHPYYVNEHYFDNPSRAMYYVLGVFYAKLSPAQENGIRFRCPSKDLVQIVKEQLDSEHVIMSDPRGKNSHWIEMQSVSYMRNKLDELGFLKHKSKRRFPKDMPKEYASHFVRGFVDAKAKVYVIDDERTNVEVHHYNTPLRDIHRLLVEYAGVKHSAPKGSSVIYNHDDSIRIHDFIYQDWEYTKEQQGLYLPSKKEAFRTNTRYVHPRTLAAQRRMGRAKNMLRRGYHTKTVVRKLGYLSLLNFYTRFKRVTGMTINEFLGRKAHWHD